MRVCTSCAANYIFSASSDGADVDGVAAGAGTGAALRGEPPDPNSLVHPAAGCGRGVLTRI